MNFDNPAFHMTTPTSPRYLVFAASLRTGSLNHQLARLVADRIAQRGGGVDLASFRTFDAPSYDQDLEEQEGIPPQAQLFRQHLAAADALVIASPEYNASFPGGLKNAIDWASRFKPNPLAGKHALLLSASPSMMGGNRGLWSLRIPLEKLGVRVFPDMFSLAQADRAWTADGQLKDEMLDRMLNKMLADFTHMVAAVKHYTPDPLLTPVVG